jgi:hypothetical protein
MNFRRRGTDPTTIEGKICPGGKTLASEIQIPMARGGEKLLSFSIDP